MTQVLVTQVLVLWYKSLWHRSLYYDTSPCDRRPCIVTQVLVLWHKFFGRLSRWCNLCYIYHVGCRLYIYEHGMSSDKSLSTLCQFSTPSHSRRSPPPPHTHTQPPFSLSLISFVVSVDVKHRVYFVKSVSLGLTAVVGTAGACAIRRFPRPGECST